MAVDENSVEKMINASMRHRNVTFIARPVGTSSQSGYLVGGFLSDSLWSSLSRCFVFGLGSAARLSVDGREEDVDNFLGRTRPGIGAVVTRLENRRPERVI